MGESKPSETGGTYRVVRIKKNKGGEITLLDERKTDILDAQGEKIEEGEVTSELPMDQQRITPADLHKRRN